MDLPVKLGNTERFLDFARNDIVRKMLKFFFTFLFLFSVLISLSNAEEVKRESSNEISFSLEEGIIFLKVHLNGKGPYTFIFDTGATETVVVPPVAKELGLALTRSGDQHTSSLKSIQVGNAHLVNLPIYVFDPPQALTLKLDSGINYHGILGYTFISKFLTTIDYPKKTVVFASFPVKETSLSSLKHPVPFKIISNHIHIFGKINNTGPYQFLLDTGATQTILTHRTARQLNLDGAALEHPKNAYSSELENLNFGDFKTSKIPIIIYDPPHAVKYGINFDAILGSSFLSQYKVTFDFQKNIVTFY
jgi:predicted aspartyl protease